MARTHKKARTRKVKKLAPKNLEAYAFWTGFASTIISLAGVLVQALR